MIYFLSLSSARFIPFCRDAGTAAFTLSARFSRLFNLWPSGVRVKMKEKKQCSRAAVHHAMNVGHLNSASGSARRWLTCSRDCCLLIVKFKLFSVHMHACKSEIQLKYLANREKRNNIRWLNSELWSGWSTVILLFLGWEPSCDWEIETFCCVIRFEPCARRLDEGSKFIIQSVSRASAKSPGIFVINFSAIVNFYFSDYEREYMLHKSN